MSIEHDIKTSQGEFRAISTLLGDTMSQFAKLFQNEIDLAKAEVGDKLQKLGGALGLIAGGAVLVIPAIVMALFAAVRSVGLRRMVTTDIVSDSGVHSGGNRCRALCSRHQTT